MLEREKMLILLQQIQMTSDDVMPHFEEALLKKVFVHEKKRWWQFHIEMPRPLPYPLYAQFMTSVSKAFESIAQVDVVINSTVDQLGDEWYEAYWPHIVHSLDISPPMRRALLQQPLTFRGAQIVRTVESDFHANVLKTNYVQLLEREIVECGLPPKQIVVEVAAQDERVEAEQLEAIAAFEAQKLAEEQQFAQRALQQKAKADEKRELGTPTGPFQLGYPIKESEPMMALDDIHEEEYSIVVEGYVFSAGVKHLKSGRGLLELKVTDYTNSIIIKMFSRDKEMIPQMEMAKEGMWIRAKGRIEHDDFLGELVMMARDVMEIAPDPQYVRTDEAEEKRIELHAHTKMSQMDSVASASELIARAAEWGHEAIAITDTANVQAFPEAYNAGKKHGIQVLFGMEAHLVDDGVPIAYEPSHRQLSEETYVVFDVETTGLSSAYDTIIEIAGVRVKDGEIVDSYESFANPRHPLSALTTKLTGITDDMVQTAPEVEQVMREFVDFCGDSILVAHNASFDMGFLYAACKKAAIDTPAYGVIDTLELSRLLYPDMRNHRLNTLAKRFNVELTQHHRAIYDTEATAHLFIKFLADAEEKGIHYLDQFNDHVGKGDAYKRSRPLSCTLLVQNEVGLKNLFKLVSYSHIDYFYRVPRIPRSVLVEHREGLLVGSGTEQGEVFETVMQKSVEEAEEVAKFYDYLEIHPKPIYEPLIERDLIHDEWDLEDIMRKMVKLSETLHIPLCATGNVRYVDPTDERYREVLIRSQGGANPLNRGSLPKAHFRTTDEMLESFQFLGDDVAKRLVIDNPKKIAEQIEDVEVIKSDLYTPEIEGADEEVKQLTYSMAHAIYGEQLPEIVQARIDKELKSIIDNGFAVIYLISHKLVKKSLDDGYLVGSRGSVGSSFVATMMEITEVNPLPPHYVCTSCHESHFFTDGSVSSGYDLPDKTCTCGEALKKDGQDIPFETFLGFKGDKVPDIDLNFSGDYQPRAHDYTRELFGEDYVYRAGTIGTIADKTAYGYVRGYMNDNELHYRKAEIERLVQGFTGVKRSTGQHPGGIIVVPDTMDIYDFTPIQYPANDQEASWKTTHFDFHSIDENLLKLDILGHDDPTMIKMLQDLSGIDPLTIPPDDPDVMSLFTSTKALGITEEQIDCKTGTLGVPEFGTRFVRQMLEETKPSTFSELIQISGLSHGTDVWLGNAQELIRSNTCVLSEVIGCRDDIMVELIYKGLEPALAFQIMEFVRKGRGLKPEWEDEMRKHNVPEWYIDSCKKIKYMFPKAHAAAYVLMALRIAYFKVHHPLMYYAAYFTVRATDYDLVTMTQGSTALREQMKDIHKKGLDATPKEKSLLTVLEIALEMCERGYSFAKPDLYRSHATDFIIDGDSLIPPFNSIPSLGTNVAHTIVEAREDGEFLSKEDLQRRGRVSKTVIEYMDQLGCLEGMPDTNQLSLF